MFGVEQELEKSHGREDRAGNMMLTSGHQKYLLYTAAHCGSNFGMKARLLFSLIFLSIVGVGVRVCHTAQCRHPSARKWITKVSFAYYSV